MPLFDTHCHIHSADYPTPIPEVEARAAEAGVDFLLCVGENAADSALAVEFVQNRPNCWAAIGQHPHEASVGGKALEKLRALLAEQPQTRVSRRSPHVQAPHASVPVEQLSEFSDGWPEGRGSQKTERTREYFWEGNLEDRTRGGLSSSAIPASSTHFSSSPARASEATASSSLGSFTVEDGEGVERRADASFGGVKASTNKIVAIGECGLDYFYGHSSKADQQTALRYQIELALEYDLPLVFHVRDAFDDFWPIFDSYSGIRGVLHSFTDTAQNAEKALARGLFIGVNGIMTFTKNQWQLDLLRDLPLERILLETDSPFLTPVPMRGTVNEPARVMLVAQFVSNLRQMSLTEVAAQTTINARHVFSI